MKLVERNTGKLVAESAKLETIAGEVRVDGRTRAELEAQGLALVHGNADERAHLEAVGWLTPRPTNGRAGPPSASDPPRCTCRDASQIERNACVVHDPRGDRRPRLW